MRDALIFQHKTRTALSVGCTPRSEHIASTPSGPIVSSLVLGLRDLYELKRESSLLTSLLPD
jgi:hypothetical protein